VAARQSTRWIAQGDVQALFDAPVVLAGRSRFAPVGQFSPLKSVATRHELRDPNGCFHRFQRPLRSTLSSGLGS
jgi:hypothetical protein